jgi:hypothetical protein
MFVIFKTSKVDFVSTGVTIAPPNETDEQTCLANESKLRDLKVKN